MAKVMTIGLEEAAGSRGEAREAAARSPYSRQVAGIVAAATVLSMVHWVYSAITFDRNELTNPAAYIVYGISWGLAALVRTDRIGAWRTAAVALALMLAVGVFYYPTVFVPARQTTFGWFEYAGYMGLLLLAEYLCLQRLRGIALTPEA